jgi:molybdopterin-guanine dinucleotide biosynthesis protein A
MRPNGLKGGIVLAGGGAKRFGGIDKSLARAGNGRTFLEEVAMRLSFLDELVVATSDSSRAVRYHRLTGVRAIVDGHPGILGGILAGLESLSAEEVFLAAVDMPLLRPDVIRRQFDALQGWDVVVPLHPNGFIEPLHVVLKRAPSIDALRILCGRGERKVSRLFDGLRTNYLPVELLRELDPELECFTNINDPGALRLLQESTRRVPPAQNSRSSSSASARALTSSLKRD